VMGSQWSLLHLLASRAVQLGALQVASGLKLPQTVCGGRNSGRAQWELAREADARIALFSARLELLELLQCCELRLTFKLPLA